MSELSSLRWSAIYLAYGSIEGLSDPEEVAGLIKQNFETDDAVSIIKNATATFVQDEQLSIGERMLKIVRGE
jgi:hypothetical protein